MNNISSIIRTTWLASRWAILPMLIGLLVFSFLFPSVHFDYQLIHTFTESCGSLIAFILALFILSMIETKRLSINFLWLIVSFISMGVLDLAHALMLPGQEFVWLHSTATFFGGITAVLIWLPVSVCKPFFNKSFFISIFLISLTFSIVSIIFPELTPSMLYENNQFTFSARILNMVGGAGFISAWIYFTLIYYRQNHQGSTYFSNQFLLFGLAGILFEISALWDGNWWLWHMLRVLAYALLMLYFAKNYWDDLNKLSRQNHAIQLSENSLKNSEARLKSFINSIPDLVWLKDKEGVYLACNNKFEALFGHKEKDIISKTDYDFVSKELADFFRDNDRAAEKLGKPRVNEEQVTYASDGHTEWLETIKAPVFDDNGNFTGVLGIGRDITIRKENSQEITSLKKRMELALSGNHDGIWDRNLLNNSIYLSPRWKEMLGYSDNELANELSSWESHIHPDDIEVAKTAIQANINAQTDKYENTYRLKHKDGHWVWILDRGKTLYDENGQAIRMVGTHTDITELSELKQALFEKEELMISQSRHAAMGEMIGMIAHQWRQPISVISMGANNILVDIELEEISEESTKMYAQNILKQTDYLSQTIEDFRSFFRPNKEIDEARPDEVMNEARMIIGKSLEHSNITFSITGKTHKIKMFSRELLQVYINLLKNAKEALVEHRIKDRQIDVMISTDHKNVITNICNNGGNIDKKIIENIFDPYFTTKSVTSGTGLGLYMSKTIIEKHLLGTITVNNTKYGVCFTITLPLQKEAHNSLAN